MSLLPTITVTPLQATKAYRGVDQGGDAAAGLDAAGGAGGGFGGALAKALGGVVEAGHAADAQAMQAMSGPANITELVGAVSKAELALQTTAAVRDRVVQAYQDIMRMPI